MKRVLAATQGERIYLWGLLSLAMLLIAGLAALNGWFGALNQDEGWYLYAAGRVYSGELPYRDFSFTQGPVFPYVFAGLYPLVERFGLAGGRGINAILGMLSILFVSGLAARLSSERWRMTTFAAVLLLAGVNVYQSYFSVVVKTYSLCAFFLSGGLLLLSFVEKDARWSRWLAAGSGLLLALAAGTRLSAGAALAVTGLYLLARCRVRHWTIWAAFGVGGGLGLAAVFGPFWGIAPEAVEFGLLKFHTLRTVDSLLAELVYKGGFVSRVVQGYFVLTMLVLTCWVMVVYEWLYCRRRRALHAVGQLERFNRKDWVMSGGLLWWVAIGISLVHLAAPFPYDDYQVIVMPVLCAAVVLSVMRRLWVLDWFSRRLCHALLTLLLLVVVAGAFSSPINQEWVSMGRDRIWWRMKVQPDLQRLQDTAAWLRERMAPDEALLTQDTYLAVEADRPVPHGLEMGPFSYYPDWTQRQLQQAGGGVNRAQLLKLLRTSNAPYAAFSGYGLSIRSPEVQELSAAEQEELQAALLEQYEEVKRVPDFGQGHTELVIYKRRNEL